MKTLINDKKFDFGSYPIPGKRRTSVVYNEDEKRVNNRLVKKLKVSIPALGCEKIYMSVKDCSEELNIDLGLLYAYIRKGWAWRGRIKFEYM